MSSKECAVEKSHLRLDSKTFVTPLNILQLKNYSAHLKRAISLFKEGKILEVKTRPSSESHYNLIAAVKRLIDIFFTDYSFNEEEPETGITLASNLQDRMTIVYNMLCAIKKLDDDSPYINEHFIDNVVATYCPFIQTPIEEIDKGMNSTLYVSNLLKTLFASPNISDEVYRIMTIFHILTKGHIGTNSNNPGLLSFCVAMPKEELDVESFDIKIDNSPGSMPINVHFDKTEYAILCKNNLTQEELDLRCQILKELRKHLVIAKDNYLTKKKDQWKESVSDDVHYYVVKNSIPNTQNKYEQYLAGTIPAMKRGNNLDPQQCFHTLIASYTRTDDPMEFTEPLIIDLIGLLKRNPNCDDQSGLHEWMYRVNYLKELSGPLHPLTELPNHILNSPEAQRYFKKSVEYISPITSVR